MENTLPWATLALLGAFHGVNPAMGWLFAVALGLQEQRRSALLAAFLPIAVGHALSIALVVTAVGLLQKIVTPTALQYASAGLLLAFGLYRLFSQNGHPRWVGMRVGFGDLTLWSFLMATAHGAGLMLTPIILQIESVAPHDHSEHVALLAAMGMGGADLQAVIIHTTAMLAVMALMALVVYEKVGLRLLRHAWFNLDYIWTSALLVAAIITLR